MHYDKVYFEVWALPSFSNFISRFLKKIFLSQNEATEIHGLVLSRFSLLLHIIRYPISYIQYFSIIRRLKLIRLLAKRQVLTSSISRKIRKIENQEELLNFSIEGFEIGRDILEAYLIEKKKENIVFDNQFIRFAEDCLRLYFSMKGKWTSDSTKKCLFLSHGIYRWGIVSKAALASNLDVFVICEASIFRLSKHNQYAIPDFGEYLAAFHEAKKSVQIAGLIWAKSRLNKRLQGVAGIDITHNTISAFNNSKSDVEIVLKKDQVGVVICPSCFYDNPHAYGDFIFSNFYEWLEFIGEYANKRHLWLVKAHPDVLPGNLEILKGICARHKHLTLIPHNTSFHSLSLAGISLCLTVYGSVGHELPFLNMNVINCSNNPHRSFGFNLHVKSKPEFKAILINPEKYNSVRNIQDIYKFYLVHFLLKKNRRLFSSERRSWMGYSDFNINDELANDLKKFLLSDDFRFIETSKNVNKELKKHM